MPVRRLNRPFVVVLTGVENAGKTTIGGILSRQMGWPLLPEAARTEAVVLDNRTTWNDLQRLQNAFIDGVTARRKALEDPVLLCDTGGLVLDMWSKEVFGRGLDRTEEAMGLMDLHLLLHTQVEWHPDPLRTLPDFDDRMALQDRYRNRLAESGHPFEEVMRSPSAERVGRARDLILQHSGQAV